jgi:uncharacterized protein YyaL (SSP411 family)
MIRRAIAAFIVSASIFGATGGHAMADYAQEAESITDYIQAHFYDGATNRYWGSYPSDKWYGMMWANGIELDALAKAAKIDPVKYKQPLYDFTSGLESYWDPIGPVPGYNAYCSGPGGTDKYYDDNEWVVLAYIDAYEATKDEKFVALANATQKFALSGWDEQLGGGIYWSLKHKGKATCSNAPAAAAAMRIAQFTGDQDQVNWALKIRGWVDGTLQDSDGLYFDNINLDGKIEKTKWTYNSALMISTNVLLYNHFKDAAYLAEAVRTADAMLAYSTDPATGSLQRKERDPIFTHLLCQSFIELYRATNDVKYLNAVRREATFALKYARDPQGGYFEHWTTSPQNGTQKKTLIVNASAAYLFWLLAPYPDVSALYDMGIKAASQGDDATAESYFQQAADSDPSDEDAAYRLWKVLVREHKTDDAETVAEKLAEFPKQ